jgi:hypothetical protein
MHQRHQDRIEVQPLGREAVFVARRVLLIGDFGQDRAVGELLEPFGKDAAADPQPFLEIVEPPHPEEAFAQDQQRPAIPDYRHGPG